MKRAAARAADESMPAYRRRLPSRDMSYRRRRLIADSMTERLISLAGRVAACAAA